MGFVTITRLTPDGVATVPLSEATDSERMNLDLSMTLGRVEMLCVWCSAPLPRGNACERHRNERGAYYLP
mgnify:CR=1 FL=1